MAPRCRVIFCNFWEGPRCSVNILGGSQVVCKCFRRLPGVGLYFAIFGRESIATVGEIRVWWRADFQSGSRVLKKVF